MFDADIPRNLTVTEPGLKDLLDLHKRDVLLSTNCHHIGVIDDFDPVTQTAKITIPYKKTFFKKSATSDDVEPYYVEYPPIIDCPVVVLGGGAGSLRFPIRKGDECLLLFNDRDIDNWFSGSQSSGTASLRLHSFSDAIAIVGIRSRLNLLKDYDPDKTELKHGDKTVYRLTDTGVAFLYQKDSSTEIGFKAGDAETELKFGDKGRVRAFDTGSSISFGTKTLIRAGDVKLQLKNESQNIKPILESIVQNITDLNSQLTSLITQISAITVTPGSLSGPSSPPLNAAAFAPISSQIASISTALGTVKTNIGGLFE